MDRLLFTLLGLGVVAMKCFDLTQSCELVVDVDNFRRQLRQSLLRPEQTAVATIRSREAIACEELIIEDWQPTPAPIQAAQLPPFHRFAVMAIAGDRFSRSAQLVASIAPQRGQTLVAILVHPRQVNELDVVVWVDNHLTPPMRLHFIGSRMDTVVHPSGVERPDDSGRSSSEDAYLRASRTDGGLGRELVPPVRRLRMLIGGAGSGGSEVARQFASLSPAHITVIDGDIVGMENLNNLPHATLRDVELNRPKVDVLIRSIHRNQPELSLTGIRTMLQSPDTVRHLARMPRYSGIVTFLDNAAARAAAAMLAKQLYIPHLDIGTLIQSGEQRVDIRLFTPGRGGCVACVPKADNLGEILYAARSPANVIQPGEPRPWNHQRDGSLLSLNSWAVSEAIRLWLRYMKGVVGSTWIRAFSVNDSPLQLFEEAVAGDRGCPICEDTPH